MKKNFIYIRIIFMTLFLYVNNWGKSQDFTCDTYIDTSTISQETISYSRLCAQLHLKVNIHFILKNDGTGNFREYDDGYGNPNYNGYYYAQDLISLANSLLANNSPMNLPVGNSTPNQNIAFRYVLSGVYFHRDDNHYNFNFGFQVHNVYGVDKNNEVNVYLQNLPAGSGGVAYCIGPCSNNAFKLHSPWRGYGQGAGAWAFAGPFNHEMGHLLGLYHSWSTDNCDDTPTHPNCWGIFEPNIPACAVPSNNVMDYNFTKDAWTPCQLMRSYAAIETGWSDYATCCSTTPATALFSLPLHVCQGQNVILDGSFRYLKPELSYSVEIYETDGLGSNTNLGGYWTQSYSGQYGALNLSSLYGFAIGKIYRVKLTVFNECGSGQDEEVKYVYIINTANPLNLQSITVSNPRTYYSSTPINIAPLISPNGATLTVKSAIEVNLKVGTNLEYGSNSLATINPSITCVNNYNSLKQTVIWETEEFNYQGTINQETLIDIYPNPSSDIFNLIIKADTEKEILVSLFNYLGNKIWEESYYLGGARIAELNLINQPSGVYFLNFELDGDLVTRKIIKE